MSSEAAFDPSLCAKCGAKLGELERFCPQCSHPCGKPEGGVEVPAAQQFGDGRTRKITSGFFTRRKVSAGIDEFDWMTEGEAVISDAEPVEPRRSRVMIVVGSVLGVGMIALGVFMFRPHGGATAAATEATAQKAEPVAAPAAAAAVPAESVLPPSPPLATAGDPHKASPQKPAAVTGKTATKGTAAAHRARFVDPFAAH